MAISALSEPYEPPVAVANDNGAPVFDGADGVRSQIPLRLVKVAEGFVSPTDVLFVPGRNDLIVVAEKAGRAVWAKLNSDQRGTLFEVTVPTESELGLLGLALHPRFVDNGKLYANYNVDDNGRLLTRISEWQVARDAEGGLSSATELRTLLNVRQPYQNHNGGQLVFGPDGFL
jgi:glucose/arabinose dehydrogenase